MRALALAVLIALVLPSAHASPGDVMDVSIEDVATLLPGVARGANVTVKLCSASGPLGFGPRVVTLEAQRTPSWLSVAFEPAQVAFPVLQPGQCGEQKSVMHMNVSLDAPAFAIGNFTVHASGPPGSASFDAYDVFRVGFHGALALDAIPQRVSGAAGEAMHVRVGITNRGNADTKFSLDALATPAAQVGGAAPLTLAPGEHGVFDVVIIPRGQTTTLQFQVTSHAYKDHTAQGASASFQLVVAASGTSSQRSTLSSAMDNTPLMVGLGSCVLLGLVLGVVLIRRRRSGIS